MSGPVLFQAMPPLSPEEYAALEASIREHGIQVPILVDENKTVIDGHHRQKIAAELGIECPRKFVFDKTEAEKRTLALSLNIDRRHLSREQKRALVAESIKADPQLSNVQHAQRTGVSDKTVGTVRQELEATSEIPRLDRTVGVDGRERPSTQPRPPVNVDPATGEIKDSPMTTTATPARAYESLEKRLADIGDLAAHGYTSGQIGAQLGITEHRVRQLARENGLEIPADRVMHKSRRGIDHTRIAQETVTAIEGLVMGLALLDLNEVDMSQVPHWATSLKNSIPALNRFHKQIKEMTQ